MSTTEEQELRAEIQSRKDGLRRAERRLEELEAQNTVDWVGTDNEPAPADLTLHQVDLSIMNAIKAEVVRDFEGITKSHDLTLTRYGIDFTNIRNRLSATDEELSALGAASASTTARVEALEEHTNHGPGSGDRFLDDLREAMNLVVAMLARIKELEKTEPEPCKHQFRQEDGEHSMLMWCIKPECSALGVKRLTSGGDSTTHWYRRIPE